MARRLEWICGVGAGAITVVWLGCVLLFGIAGTRTVVSPIEAPQPNGRAFVPVLSFGPIAIQAVGLLMLAGCVVALSADQHRRQPDRQGLVLLWLSSLLFLTGSTFMIFSLGPALALAAALSRWPESLFTFGER
jgi:hypothetical protein